MKRSLYQKLNRLFNFCIDQVNGVGGVNYLLVKFVISN